MTEIERSKFVGETSPRIDVHVGLRVRLRRRIRDVSQAVLADMIGISHQQMHKCERGYNRISAGRLYQLSEALDVPISFFFEGIEQTETRRVPGFREKPPTPFQHDVISHAETLELVRAYYSISNKNVRKRLYEFVKALAKPDK